MILSINGWGTFGIFFEGIEKAVYIFKSAPLRNLFHGETAIDQKIGGDLHSAFGNILKQSFPCVLFVIPAQMIFADMKVFCCFLKRQRSRTMLFDILSDISDFFRIDSCCVLRQLFY